MGRRPKADSGPELSFKDIKGKYDPASDVLYLRRRIEDMELERSSSKLAAGEQLDIAERISSAVAKAVPVKIVTTDTVRADSPVTHVLHLTDIHYGEITPSGEIDGFGEYSPELAESRIRLLTQKILDKTQLQRNAYNVNELRILGTADYISGDIHQELQVTNAFPSPVQAVRCGYLLGAMFMALAPHFEKIVVDLITLDNHGRMTRKPQSAEGGQNNWCYVVAHVAAQHCVNQKNIQVNIHDKPSALIHVGPESYLIFHGHQIKAWAGIPYYGLDRRAAMEALKRMGVPDKTFTRIISGHLHHSVDGMFWRTGGSLSGTSVFDHNCGRKAAPHQTSWFVHPQYGDFDINKWWL